MILLLAPASAIRLPVVRRRDAVALGAAAGLGQRAASAAESGSPAARLEAEFWSYHGRLCDRWS